MRIAVVGGTGTIGRHLVSGLERQGHEVRALSRHSRQFPVDLRTGAGLDRALQQCEVVIDASNGPPSAKARAVLVDGSQRLLGAEERAGVAHHVCVSIVGIDAVPMAYYRVKLEQERIVERGPVAWTIVRSTQFHDLLASMLAAAARVRVLPAARARFQPVDAGEAASAVASVALAAPLRSRVMLAGPEVHDLRSLGRAWRAVTRRRAVELPVPMPGRLGRALREGRLTCAEPDVRGHRTFEAWLRDTIRSTGE